MTVRCINCRFLHEGIEPDGWVCHEIDKGLTPLNAEEINQERMCDCWKVKKKKRGCKKKIHELKLEKITLPKRWRKDYMLRNHAEAIRWEETPKGLVSTVLWDGKVDLKTLCGNGNPRSWRGTASGCYLVYFLDMLSGQTRLGRACRYARMEDIGYVLYVKTPEAFIKRIKDPIPGSPQNTKSIIGDSNPVPLNNVLWALDCRRTQRMKGGHPNRLQIVEPAKQKDSKEKRKDKKRYRSEGKKEKRQKASK